MDLEHHLEDIRLTIEAARRENLRDVWAQKSRRAETLLIMSSLMIGGFFSLVVEGLPPIDVWPALLSLYSVCLALSFSALFLCLFLSMKFSSRMTDFNIYKPHQIYTCGNTHESFESYYECHCAQPAHAASVMFYAGTLLLVTAAALLQFSRWYLTYGNAVAASLYVGVAGVTMASLMLFYRLLPTKVLLGAADVVQTLSVPAVRRALPIRPLRPRTLRVTRAPWRRAAWGTFQHWCPCGALQPAASASSAGAIGSSATPATQMMMPPRSAATCRSCALIHSMRMLRRARRWTHPRRLARVTTAT